MAEFWQWQGDLPTGSGYVMLKDGSGRQGMNTIFGDAINATRITSIGIGFQYNLATDDVTTTIIDTGTATQSDHQAVVQTGSGTTASATIQSVEHVRYSPGHDSYANFTTEFSIPQVGSNQRIGPFDASDGFFIGFTGTTFGVTKRKDGVDTTVAQPDFNLDKLDGSGPDGLNLNFSFGNVWRIDYGWLGHSTIIFEVMDNNGTWIE